jgi:acetylornithine deacetylase
MTGAPYGTDASRLSRAGIPSVVIGPGNSAQAHTADEWIETRQVEQATRIYQEIMEKF